MSTADQLNDFRCANGVLHRTLTEREEEIKGHLATIERLKNENAALVRENALLADHCASLKVMRVGTGNVAATSGMGWK